ncbi:MAG: nrfG, partial [Akkermansiaceae bacterium]|nr:nrfG [Akkermansiaceae bacterium]
MRTLRYLLPAAALALASCGTDKDLPPLLNNGATNSSSGKAESIYQEAKSADASGKTSRAAKLYGKAADEAPVFPHAPEARYRQAEILQQEGNVRESFDAYQEFLTRYNSSSYYQKALDTQAAMAQAAADGQVKTSFLGLKSRLSNEKIADMLAKVRQNAPRSPTAAKAQFTIGKIWESDTSSGSAAKAITAYRELSADYPDSPQAPEGQFLIGKILLDEARRGNHDQANLDRAKEAFQDYLRRYPNHSRAG